MSTIFQVTCSRSFILSVVFISLFTFVVSASAQEENTTQVTSEETEQGVLLATVNIQDASFTQEGNTFTINFNISNRIGIQSGVKYGVMLVKNTPTGQVIADEYVYDESLSLHEGESIARTITYSAPIVFDGTYALLLNAKSENGFPFGLSFIGEILLKKSASEGVYIYPETCYLTISNDISNTHYDPRYGIDIASTESLTSHCEVQNISEKDISVLPTVTTHARTSYGVLVPTAGGDVTPIKFKPNEKRVIHTLLPTSKVPQAYELALQYGENSNKIIHRYVVQGGSGTIQNLVFDKDAYGVGDTAIISFIWSPAADSFDGSRGTTTTLTQPKVILEVQNGEGVTCANQIEQGLASVVIQKIEIPIIALCTNPKIYTTLKDDSYGELSTATFKVNSLEQKESTTSSLDEQPQSTFPIKLIALIVLVLLIIVSIFYLKPKKINSSVLTIFFILGLSLFGNVQNAFADTFTASSAWFGGDRTVFYTVNLNKATYAPNELMTLTGSGQANLSCGNSCTAGGLCRAAHLWVTAMDSVAITNIDIISLQDIAGGSTVYGTGSLNAPVAGGSHNVSVQGTAVNVTGGPGYGVVLPFTVTAATYTYTFNSNGGAPTYSSVTGVTGSAVASPGTPTRTGYTFNGWLPSLPTTMPSGGGGSVAQWTVNSYTYTFNGNGATTNPSPTSRTQNYNTALAAPTAPLRTNYTFAGWSPAIPATMPVGGGSSAAQWTSLPDLTPNSLVVPGSGTSGVSLNFSAFVKNNSTVGTGIGFSDNYKYQWNGTGGAWMQATEIFKGALGAGATSNDPASMTPNQSGTLYIQYCVDFNNAINEGSNETPNCLVSGGIPISSSTYSFNSNGGTPIYSSVTGAVGSTVNSPGNPTQTGYTFNGWLPSLPTTMPSGGGGSVAQWTVTPAVPTVISSTHANVTQTTATLGATVFSSGSSAITARGTCWGLSANPVSNCAAEGGTAVSAFTQARSGFSPGTTYYYRGYATNAVGTGYSADSSFETLANVPISLTITPQACGTGQNFLDWADAVGADNYSIYSSTGVWIGNSIGSNYTHNGSLSTSYSYYVRANNTAGVQSANSATVSATTAGACVVYSCTGSDPANAGVLCSGDSTGLSADTPKTAVGSCTATKCEYTCNAGYVFSAGSCIPITYVCTGSIPSNASICALDDQSLGADTSRTVVSSCTSTKCEYTCNAGYNAVAGSCVALPTLTASPVIVNQGSQTTLSWTLGGQTCTLNGGTYNNVSLSANGSFTPTINANTTYTLTCPSGTATVTVEIIPTGFET